MDDFLQADFDRIGDAVLGRCTKLDGRRLYLTGASGFFGKNILSLLSHLARRGATFRVTALSRAPQRFLDEQPWCRRLDWLDWEWGDAREPWPGSGHFDYVLHGATETNAEAHRDRRGLFEQMLMVTRNALVFAERHGVRRLLLTGSGAQYGSLSAESLGGVAESSMTACDPTRAGSAYGEGKRASEMLAALHAETCGLEVINTRCFAFVGPGLPLHGHYAIGNFLRDALAGGRIELVTTGEAVRSYLYSADLAVWLLLLLLEAQGGSIVNVGSNEAVRIRDLAARVRDVVHPGLEVRSGSRPSEGERDFYVPSIGPAQSMGLAVWTTLDQAIARTALWHRSRPRTPSQEAP